MVLDKIIIIIKQAVSRRKNLVTKPKGFSFVHTWRWPVMRLVWIGNIRLYIVSFWIDFMNIKPAGLPIKFMQNMKIATNIIQLRLIQIGLRNSNAEVIF